MVLLDIIFIIISGCAGNTKENTGSWVNYKLEKMSMEEKIGQMMVPAFIPRFFNDENEEYKWLIKLVKDKNIGGITFYRGHPYKAASAIERFQEAAEIPLLVMADMEWGLPCCAGTDAHKWRHLPP